MRRFWSYSLACAGSLILSGCATMSGVTGDETVFRGVETVNAPGFRAKALSSAIQQREEEYLEFPRPLFFLVSENGEYAYRWGCRDSNCYVPTNRTVLLEEAISDCERLALYAKCYLRYFGETKFGADLPLDDGFDVNIAPGEQIERRGPETAAGKIFYLPGFPGLYFDQPNFIRARDDGSLPILPRYLAERGWDVDVVVIDHFSRAMFKEDDAVWRETLTPIVQQAKDEGYERVVLMGMSGGGNEAMRALADGLMVDAAVLLEPDWVGPKFIGAGRLNPKHRGRVSRLVPFFEKIKTPRLVFAAFSGSAWYGDTPLPEFKRLAPAHRGHTWVIDRPAGHLGHGGAMSMRFANQYGECMDRFLKGDFDDPSSCPIPKFHFGLENATNLSQLTAVGANRVRDVEAMKALLEGKVWCPYDAYAKAGEPAGSCERYDGAWMIEDSNASAANRVSFKRPYAYWEEEEMLCVWGYSRSGAAACLELYKIAKDRAGGLDVVSFVTPKSKRVFTYVADPSYRLKPGDTLCTTQRGAKRPVCEPVD